MAERPQDFADPPPASPGDADPLSDVLRAVRLTGDTVTRHDGADGPVVDYPAGPMRLHLVRAGTVRLRYADRPSVQLGPGDLLLVGRDLAHTVHPDEHAAWATGDFRVDPAAGDDLLTGLPEIVVVPHRAEATWLPLSVDLLMAEVDRPRPGSQVMIARILDLLFIHVLRSWFDSGQAEQGWLTAVMDPLLGPVLAAVNRDPGRDWSVASLARLAMLSRSAFARRFTELLGMPPGAYVANRRLERAAQLLTQSGLSVQDVGAAVGYASEAAFSRAFRRRHGQPPGVWRREAVLRG